MKIKDKWKKFAMGHHFCDLPKNWVKAYDSLMKSEKPEKLCAKWEVWFPYESFSTEDLIGRINDMAEEAQRVEESS